MTQRNNPRKLIFALLIPLFALMSLPVYANAQTSSNVETLEQMSILFADRLQSRRPQIYYDYLSNTEPAMLNLNQNRDIQLIYVDTKGRPYYYAVENVNAAKTINTYEVWPGGSGGFTLSGSSTILGELCIWDGGGVLTSHQEFSGRVTQIDSPGSTHYHATHVAGTMIASGYVDSAKGMSFAGNLAAYDWNNDNSEMASAAASGMNVSNHSYGYITGWYWSGDWYWFGDLTVSTTEDYGFGYYNYMAQEWDSIAVNAPYYTILKSAGNDRNDYGPESGEGHYVWDNGSWEWSFDYRTQRTSC